MSRNNRQITVIAVIWIITDLLVSNIWWLFKPGLEWWRYLIGGTIIVTFPILLFLTLAVLGHVRDMVDNWIDEGE